MTTPLWVLLAFAVWTLLVLIAGVGFYRTRRILTGKAEPVDFPGGVVEGTGFYARATRAHANCLETLPVYASLALIAAVLRIDTQGLDVAAIILLIGRICQSLIHMSLPITNLTVRVRGLFFLAQVIAMLWMAVIIARAAGGGA